jgi:uncharacterized protein (TIGR03437 family)
VFIADTNGIRPLLIRNRDVFPANYPPASNPFTTNFYNLVGISVASDVSQMAIVGLRECMGLTSGLCRYPDSTTVYNARGETVFSADGHLAVSPNGRWGLVTAIRLTSPETEFTLADLVTGVRYTLPSVSGNRDWQQHDVANNGTVVIAGVDRLILFRPPNMMQTLEVDYLGLIGTGVVSATIDAGGTTVVWEQADLESRGLRVAKPGPTVAPINLQVPGRNDYAPRISEDGSRILFLSTPALGDDPQLFTMQIDGSGRRQITAEPGGIANAILSGSGQVAWAVTRTGRVLQIRVASGDRREIIGPIAAFLLPAYYLGTQVRPTLLGAAGQAVTVPASVMPGETVEIQLGTRPLAVVRVGTQSVTFQVPWDVDDNRRYEVTIRKSGSVAWTGSTTELYSFLVRPSFLFAEWGYALAAHQYFEATVTPERPASPGEIVHLYGIGFGPVSPPVAEGTPAPIAPLSRISAPIFCYARNPDNSRTLLDLLYAGLAPGEFGVYQFDIRLPQAINGDGILIGCVLSGPHPGFTEISVPMGRRRSSPPRARFPGGRRQTRP